MMIQAVPWVFALLTCVSAVNYQPPSQGNILQIRCPDPSTLELKLNPQSAVVYSNYIASQSSWPTRLFMINNDTTESSTQCSPPGTLAAFSVEAAGSLSADRGTYTITKFTRLSAPDAIKAARADMQKALKPNRMAEMANLANVYNSDPNARLDKAFSKSLKVPQEFKDIIEALGKLENQPVQAINSRDVDKRAAAVVVVAASNPVGAVILTAIAVTWATVTALTNPNNGLAGGAGNVKDLVYPTIYVLPWWVSNPPQTGSNEFPQIGSNDIPQTGSSDSSQSGNNNSPQKGTTAGSPGDPKDPSSGGSTKNPDTCDDSGSPSPQNLPDTTSTSKPNSGPCTVTLKNVKMTQPEAKWTFSGSTVSGNLGSSEYSGTLNMHCDPPPGWTDKTELSGKPKWPIFDTLKGVNLDEPKKDQKCDPFPDLPNLKVVPYIQLNAELSYNMYGGGGDIDMDFIVRLGQSILTLDNVYVKSDASNASLNDAATVKSLTPKSEPIFEVTKFSASVSAYAASVGVPLTVGIKTFMSKVEILDANVAFKPEFKFTGSNLVVSTKKGGNAARQVTPSEVWADSLVDEEEVAFPTAVITPRKTGHERREAAQSMSSSSTSSASTPSSTAKACDEVLNIKGGFEAAASIKALGKKIFSQTINQISWVPVKASALTACSDPIVTE